MLNDRKFKNRSDIIGICLAAWTLICLFMFLYYSVLNSDMYIYLGNKLARRHLLYYPERGKILDKNGIILSWSEKHFDLYYNDLTGSPRRTELIYQRVKKIIPEAVYPNKKVHSILQRSLKPGQILSLEELVCLFQELQIEPRIERKIVDYPSVRKIIGQVKVMKGRVVGVSGLEKVHDEILSGKPGKYQIMLDSNKNWIKNSGRSISRAVPGNDIRLDMTIEEIRKEEK